MLNVLGKLVQMLLWDLKNSVRCQDVENENIFNKGRRI